MLEEVGASYRIEVLHFGTTMKDEAYRAINPMAKVPTLVHGNNVVTECAAICAYLADAFPDTALAPPPGRRADYYRWMFFAAGPLEASVSNRVLGFEVPPEKERMIGYGTYEAVMNALEQVLTARPYIAGDAFTAADVYVGTQIGWGMQHGSVERRPSFQAYFGRLSSRQAYQLAAEKDNALAAELQDVT